MSPGLFLPSFVWDHDRLGRFFPHPPSFIAKKGGTVHLELILLNLLHFRVDDMVSCDKRRALPSPALHGSALQVAGAGMLSHPSDCRSNHNVVNQELFGGRSNGLPSGEEQAEGLEAVSAELALIPVPVPSDGFLKSLPDIECWGVGQAI